MEKWVVAAKRADFDGIAKKYGISPVLARIIRNRDVVEEQDIEAYLSGTKADLKDPLLMKDMERAVEILREKIASGNKIRIMGDYDIDGVTSTHILRQGLKRCGADVDFEIPDRIKDGYGINEQLISQAHQDGVDTIVTCDNGIAAMPAVRLAKELGMTIIVTDHHDIPFEESEEGRREILPPADAVVNPKQKECRYPFKNLCGAGVAYKLVEALYRAYQIGQEEVYPFLEFAAIATIGDVMDLQGENRIIVKEGLKLLRKTRNIGLKALIDVNNLDASAIKGYHVGFIIGPCINASGRLDTAKRVVCLFESQDEKEAYDFAADLKALNDSRKSMTLQNLEEATHQVEQSDLKDQKILVVYLPDCHESLAGIVAGRLKERYNKPAIVLTKGEEGVKGSGRSIETYDMFEELTRCKEYFLKFGGHPMAAGMSLPEENVEPLRNALNQKTTLTDEDLIPKVTIDVPMPIDYITETFVKELDLLEPFGKGNSKPLFAERGLHVHSGKIMGKNRNVFKLSVENKEKIRMEAMYFGNVEEFQTYLEQKFSKAEVEKMLRGERSEITIDVTYYPDINEFNGRRTLQIVIQNYR